MRSLESSDDVAKMASEDTPVGVNLINDNCVEVFEQLQPLCGGEEYPREAYPDW